MTAITAPPSDDLAEWRHRPPPALRIRAGNLVASEWIKIRSVRSTYLTLLSSAFAAILIGVLVARHYVTSWDTFTPLERAAFDPIDTSFRGFGFAQLAIASLGVLVISSEYATGLIRVTLGATPRRRAVLAAKAVIFGVIAFVTGLVLSFSCFWIGQAILSGKHLGVSLTDPGALRAVLAAAFYLLVAGLIGLGLGAVLRYTAGAMAAAIGLLFLLPQVVGALPTPWRDDIGKFLPENLISQLVATHPSVNGLPTGWCWVLLVAYPAVLLAAGASLISRRDA
jgi:ABC-2 type transport system permease protein